MSPWQFPRPHRHSGFTLVELLVVVLIIGVLAAIALPNFIGQRTRAKNVAAVSAVRNAVSAAQAYYVQNESYVGLSSSVLNSLEGSISQASLASSATPGSGANPQSFYVASDASGSAPTASTVILCAAGRGDAIYCAKGNSGTWTYARSVGSAYTVAMVASAVFTADGWNPSYTSEVKQTYGLVSLWKLDESSGTTATDTMGTSNGTYSGSGVTLGQSGPRSGMGAASFDGVAGAVSAPSVSALNPGTGDYSLEIWAKGSSQPSYAFLMGKDGSGCDCSWELRLRNDNGAMQSRPTGNASLFSGTRSLWDNSWHHLVMTVSRSGYAIFYLDGGEEARTSISAYSTNDMTSAQLVYLGRRGGATPFYYNGLLSHAAYYNRALGPEEVSAHFRAR